MKTSLDLAIPRFAVQYKTAKLGPKKMGLASKFALFAAIFSLGLIFHQPQKEALENNLTPTNLLYLTNVTRHLEGLNPLRSNTKLMRAAEQKARNMLKEDYFAHTSPSGIPAWEFMQEEGLIYLYAGENLALNYTNSFELHNDFLKSPDHRANLLSPLYSEMGIAIVQGQFQGRPAVLTVELFARPAETVAKH